MNGFYNGIFYIISFTLLYNLMFDTYFHSYLVNGLEKYFLYHVVNDHKSFTMVYVKTAQMARIYL